MVLVVLNLTFHDEARGRPAVALMFQLAANNFDGFLRLDRRIRY